MASNRGQGQRQQQGAFASSAAAAAANSSNAGVRNRRRPGAGFNIGGTLQSSVSANYRRRSTATSTGRFGYGDSISRATAQAHLRGLHEDAAASRDIDAASIDYDNLDELFNEPEPAPI
ncbi:hypothetical protein GGI12_004363, partial [Dipsacomyces acuminosporus]